MRDDDEVEVAQVDDVEAIDDEMVEVATQVFVIEKMQQHIEVDEEVVDIAEVCADEVVINEYSFFATQLLADTI